jgi:type I restriction enzyme S subunit
MVVFYREDSFQSTPAGELPKGWEARKVEDLFVVETGTTPSTKQAEYWEGGTINWITPTDLSRLNGEIRIKGSERKVTDKALKETNLRLLPIGAIILSTRAPVGYVAMLEDSATFNQGCKGLIPRNSREISPEFYCYYLLSKKQMLQNLSSGSTFKELSKDRLEKFHVLRPPLFEQLGVIEVLGVVDSAIELADKVIVKTKRLKTGLVQQLLTRGIEHTEYKDTPIGKIPESWHVADFNTICQDIIGGVAIETKDFTDSGFPVVSKGDIKEFGQLVLDKKEKKYVSEEFAEMYPNQIAHQGELVLAMRDLSTEMNFLGLAGRVIDNHDYLAAQGVGILRINEEIVEPDFVTNLTNSKRYREFIKRRGVGSTQVHLRTNELLSFEFGLPPLSEQRQIVFILSIVDQKLRLEKQEKAKLEQLKLGLMDLLLFGKVRIKVD